jgi:predicted transposase YdaD
LLPFYIIKTRKAARQARTKEELAKLETGFKELALKLKDAIERSLNEGVLVAEDIVTLLERLSHIVEYAGEKYKSATEVKEMLDTSLMGYGQVVRMEGERIGEQKGKREGILEAARNALNEGLSMEQVARISGIPADELKKHFVDN